MARYPTEEQRRAFFRPDPAEVAEVAKLWPQSKFRELIERGTACSPVVDLTMEDPAALRKVRVTDA